MLDLMLLLPVLGAILLLLLPKEQDARWWAFFTALLTFLVACDLIPAAIAPGGYVNSIQWIPAWGVHFSLSLDGLSLVLVLLTTLISAIAIGWEGGRPRAYHALFLLMEASVIGAFLAQDLLLFYVFWEAMIVPAYMLIATYGGERRTRAAMKFLLYSLIPSLPMLVSIVVLGYQAYLRTGHWNFSIPALLHLGLGTSMQMWLFAGFALAFLVKIPAFPLHSWMPEAYAESPAPVTAMLSGALSKTALYGFLRIAIPILPVAAHRFAPLLATLAIIGILYGALVALSQRDGKLVIGYSSLSHLGLVLLAIATLSYTGLQGAVLQMVNHGVYVAALFLLFGLVERALGTRDLGSLGGLEARGPVLAGLFLVSVLTALGLPGLQGFSGEMAMLVGIYHTNHLWAWLGVIGVILAAAYFIRLFQKVAHGTPGGGGRVEIGPLHILLVAPLIMAMFFFGLDPSPIPQVTRAPLHHVATLATRSHVKASTEVAVK